MQSQAIPGAADVIEHLKVAGIPYKFVTNTTTDKRAGTRLGRLPALAEQLLAQLPTNLTGSWGNTSPRLSTELAQGL
jgi:hypothetical protein